MKTSNRLTLSASPSIQPARKLRSFASLSLRRRSIYGRERRCNAGKELDNETGLYYYGARYLDPKTSRWLSGDPAVGEYVPSAPVNEEAKKRNGSLPGMGGVFNYANLHVYHYAGNNPVRYTDPDGREDEDGIIAKISNYFKDLKKEREYNSKFNLIIPEDNRSLSERLTKKDAEQYTPYFEHSETGEIRPLEFVTGTPPAVSTGRIGIVNLIKNLFRTGPKALTVANGVDITLKNGQLGQVLIQNNKIVGFSTKYLKHIDLAKSLGLDPTKVTGATVFTKGSELIVAPSATIPGASQETLGLIYGLFH